MRLFRDAFRFQAALTLRSPDTVHVLVTAPLYTVVFMAISRHAHRTDLAAYAVLAPVLMSLWSLALLTAGDLISRERSRGTLEAMVATPASFPVVVLARITAVTTISTVSFVESWLVAWWPFGVVVRVEHPLTLLWCLVLSALAMAGTASAMSALYVLLPTARTLQNSFTYPFYLLGGILVPVSYLPEWLRPLSRLVFLSWSSDLLRSALSPAPVVDELPRLAAIAVLGAAGCAVGGLMITRILRRVRSTGTLART
ncbi:ABC transporter permease [Umezawaea tangerina]|uniref:ABC-2 type transport system permease protein n=1 Tax=Umezawaea tangerina TaxID=84725 RepID=A0A2T0T7Z5_9PSEU|nr:ABC transporter permease [Umezawaea tangerina]PRY41794.1 ABC-2 type transport system permease protein [Umezawaea tangerina]